MKITCTKKYSDLPFAHRQPSHDGHCAWIHGHNWSFEFEFGATKLDDCGFVIDFGKLKWLKEWIWKRFDHTLVLNEDDPFRTEIHANLTNRGGNMLANLFIVPDCSSEGLAAWLLDHVGKLIKDRTDGRVFVNKVLVIEDSKNHATATL